MARRVAVVFGGRSSEHDISLRSAATLLAELPRAGFEVLPVRIDRDGGWNFGPVLENAGGASHAADVVSRSAGHPVSAGRAAARLMVDVDVVFPVIHGEYGEDGRLQGFLEILGLPYVGSRVLASALCMDKARSKRLLEAESAVETLPSVTVEAHHWHRDPSREQARVAPLPLPWVVKPVDAGSSVGLSLVEQPGDLQAAVTSIGAALPGSAVLVESFAEGLEVTCVLIGNPEDRVEALPPVLIRSHTGKLFDMEAKYTPGRADEICPAPLPEAVLERIQRDAVTAYQVLGCRGFARIDFIVAGEHLYFLEANTLPGLTAESLVPKAARAAGIELWELLKRVVEWALPDDRLARSVGVGE